MKITDLSLGNEADQPQRKQRPRKITQYSYILYLPGHIMLEIVCRIPIKMLLRCRCVCKSWRSLFSNSLFTKTLFVRTRPLHLVHVLNSDTFFLLDFKADTSPNGIATLRLPTNLTNHTSRLDIVGSCNGFLCLYDRLEFYLCNPIIGEYSLLANRSTRVDFPTFDGTIEKFVHTQFLGCGFGYSALSGAYKVVLISESDIVEVPYPGRKIISPGSRPVMVLTVGSDSWRYVGESFMCHFDNEQAVYFNGFLHWIGEPVEGSRFVYAFDVESETFRQIPLPPCILFYEPASFNLGVLNDELWLTTCSSKNITAWVMKGYGKDSWTGEFGTAMNYFLPTEASKFPELPVILYREMLLAYYSPEQENYEKIEVDVVSCSIGEVCVYTPSFVSLKDAIRVQKFKIEMAPPPFRRSGKSNRVRGNCWLERPPAQKQPKIKRGWYLDITCGFCGGAGHNRKTCKFKDQATSSNEPLNAGNLQSIAAPVEQKQGEIRAPNKANTAHKDQPMQASTSQPAHDHASSSQPTHPSSEPFKPVQSSHNWEEDDDQETPKELELLQRSPEN